GDTAPHAARPERPPQRASVQVAPGPFADIVRRPGGIEWVRGFVAGRSRPAVPAQVGGRHAAMRAVADPADPGRPTASRHRRYRFADAVRAGRRRPVLPEAATRGWSSAWWSAVSRSAHAERAPLPDARYRHSRHRRMAGRASRSAGLAQAGGPSPYPLAAWSGWACRATRVRLRGGAPVWGRGGGRRWTGVNR